MTKDYSPTRTLAGVIRELNSLETVRAQVEITLVAEPGPGVDTRALYDRIREFANDAAREMASKRRVELLEAIGKLRRESQAEIDELLGRFKATTFVDAAEVKPAAHDATRFKRMYDEAVALLDIGYGFASPDWING